MRMETVEGTHVAEYDLQYPLLGPIILRGPGGGTVRLVKVEGDAAAVLKHYGVPHEREAVKWSYETRKNVDPVLIAAVEAALKEWEPLGVSSRWLALDGDDTLYVRTPVSEGRSAHENKRRIVEARLREIGVDYEVSCRIELGPEACAILVPREVI